MRREIAGALDWWREAGVDLSFEDVARPLIAPPQAPAARARTLDHGAAPTKAPVGPASPDAIDLSALPGELAAFREWWLQEPSLDAGRTQGRLPPRGPQDPQIMILVGDPEPVDSDSLLSGPQGRLVDAFLAAAGIDRDHAYFASVLPRSTPHADWAAVAARGFGAVLARHVALVRPRRIVAFDGINLPLNGNDWPNSPDSLRRFNHEGLNIPLFAARGLAAILTRGRWKAGLWQGWLNLTRDG